MTSAVMPTTGDQGTINDRIQRLCLAEIARTQAVLRRQLELARQEENERLVQEDDKREHDKVTAARIQVSARALEFQTHTRYGLHAWARIAEHAERMSTERVGGLNDSDSLDGLSAHRARSVGQTALLREYWWVKAQQEQTLDHWSLEVEDLPTFESLGFDTSLASMVMDTLTAAPDEQAGAGVRLTAAGHGASRSARMTQLKAEVVASADALEAKAEAAHDEAADRDTADDDGRHSPRRRFRRSR